MSETMSDRSRKECEFEKKEIEVTPEMLQAGADVLSPKLCCRLVDSFVSPAEVAEAVFQAMILASK